MAFDEDDTVTLHDEHSEHDGQVGTVTQVMETMFGDATYTVEFADGREQGVPEDALEAADPADLPDGSEGAADDAEPIEDEGEQATDDAEASDD